MSNDSVIMRPDANKGLDDKLYTVKYEVDEENSHLSVIDPGACIRCKKKPCISKCPAEVYRWLEDEQTLEIAYENCLECGTCRVVCPYDNFEWEYPRGGFGVAYKFG